MSDTPIYLDYAATTPLDPTVLAAMTPYLTAIFGNASSQHGFGASAARAVDAARDTVAEFFGCRAQEVIFTSGATESNNLALRGSVAAARRRGATPHVITSAIEHPSVLETVVDLEKTSQATVTIVPVDQQGIISVDEVVNAIRPETVLVSIMYANNEIGTIQPIREIGKRLEKINVERTVNNFPAVVFHTDAVQAIHYLPADVKHLHVDLLSFSAHKIHGPKGVGGLIVRRQTPLIGIQTGGEHEYGLRAGSLNVAGIVGCGAAVSLITGRQAEYAAAVSSQRGHLWQLFVERLPDLELNGHPTDRLPNNLNIFVPGVESESLCLALDRAGVAVSVGSACAAGAVEPSHVIAALGDTSRSRYSFRITLSRLTTTDEITRATDIITTAIERLRQLS